MVRNVSCLNSKALIEYVRRHYPEFLERLLKDLDPFFDSVDNVEKYLIDEHNWISQYVCAKMFERVRRYSGNPEIARGIGHESITYRSFGYIENIFIKAFGTPYLSILRAPAINAKFNRTKIVEIVKVDRSHATLRLKWFKNIGSTKDICLYNQGIYEAIPTIWGLPMAKTVENKCFFEGDEYCEYAFEWAKKSFLAMIFGRSSYQKEIFNDSLTELEHEKKLVEKKYRELESLNVELKKKVEQLTSLNTCSKAITSILDTDRLLDIIVALITNIMQFDRALIMLVDEENKRLVPAKTVGGDENAIEQLKDYSISLERTNNILARVANSGIAQIVRDVEHSFLRKENIILKKFQPKSFVAVPLITHNKVIGVLGAERYSGLEDFTSSDLEYVKNFCNQIAISLENAKLIKSMKKSFLSSILSLASALEAKDIYTRGHSDRVATYSTIIALRMGLNKDVAETLRLMSLMHDIGKIGLPDSILNKRGKLTHKEFMIVKSHPIASVNIIKPLLVTRPEMHHIKNHHERYDGLGYPDGLSGKDIPLEARIMAVADSFDAMTSQRPYRSAMTTEAALTEIERNKNTQFCPVVSKVFTEIISSLPDNLEQWITEYSAENGKDKLLAQHFL